MTTFCSGTTRYQAPGLYVCSIRNKCSPASTSLEFVLLKNNKNFQFPKHKTEKRNAETYDQCCLIYRALTNIPHLTEMVQTLPCFLYEKRILVRCDLPLDVFRNQNNDAADTGK